MLSMLPTMCPSCSSSTPGDSSFRLELMAARVRSGTTNSDTKCCRFDRYDASVDRISPSMRARVAGFAADPAAAGADSGLGLSMQPGEALGVGVKSGVGVSPALGGSTDRCVERTGSTSGGGADPVYAALDAVAAGMDGAGRGGGCCDTGQAWTAMTQ